MMAKDPFEQFAVPNELRAFAEQSVTQARKAFDSFVEAANQAMGQFQGHAQAAQSSATEIAHKSMDVCRAERDGKLRLRAKADARQGRGRGDGAAVGIFEPPDAGAFGQVHDLGQSCGQDRGRCRQTQAQYIAAYFDAVPKITIISIIYRYLCIAIISCCIAPKTMLFLGSEMVPGLRCVPTFGCRVQVMRRPRATGGEAASRNSHQ